MLPTEGIADEPEGAIVGGRSGEGRHCGVLQHGSLGSLMSWQ